MKIFRSKHHDKSRVNVSYSILFLLGIFSLILLVPLRGFTLSIGPAVAVPAAFVVFMLPGAAMLGLLYRGSEDEPDVPAKVPLAFALSTGVFGFLALLPLVLRWSLEAYLLPCAAVVALSLAGLALLALWKTGSSVRHEIDGYGSWLWLPLLALTGILAVFSRRIFHPPNADTWAYLMYVQKFLSLDRINSFAPEGFSRTTLSGWLLEQAALSRLSGADPVTLMLQYLGPALVVVSVLAFYALSLTIFKNKTAALLSACLAALFFLSQMESSYDSVGNYFVGRIAEDKFVTRFIFLPVALGLAVQYLRHRNLRVLLLFALVCWSAASVHPIGLALIAIAMTGFGLVHLAINFRSRRAWTSFVALGIGASSISVPPLIYLLVTGSSFPSIMTSRSSAVEDSLISRSLAIDRLIPFGDGAYIMDPSLLLSPVMFVAYLLGVPFLIWRIERSVAAQLLLGMLLFTAALVYVPPLAAVAGDVVGPWTLWRLAWPIPLAAVLTVSWMAWALLRFAGRYLEKFRFGGSVAPLLPVILVVILAVAAMPATIAGARSIDRSGETPQNQTTCSSPVFSWMQRELTGSNIVILAPNRETECFPAYVPGGVPVGYRSTIYEDGSSDPVQDSAQDSGTPQTASDKLEFFDSTSVDEEMLKTLQRYAVDYVMLPSNSPLNAQFLHLPGFDATNNPKEKYQLYEVDVTELEFTQLPVANGLLNSGEWETALTAYEPLLQGDADQQFLAYLGMGQAYSGLDFPLDAASSYEQAIQIFPENETAHSLLAEAYVDAEDLPSARSALEEAISLAPRNPELRFELGDVLMELQEEQAALQQYRKVVDQFPEVPEYRAQLGEALNEVRRFEAAEEQFERAIRRDPLSPQVHVLVAQANLSTGRLKKAVGYYEEALELEPDNPKYSLQLGLTYFRLATREDGGDEFAEKAERQLTKAYEARSSNEKQRARAQFVLGRLYEQRDQREKAVATYERALEVDPDFAPARRRLEVLQNR